MTRRRAWTIAVSVAVAALLAGLATALHWMSQSPGGSAEAFYAQTFDDLDGRAESMGRWRNQVVVVNFWATWCAPCVEEMPLLQSIHDEYRARGVAVVGLGIDAPSALRRFRDEHRLSLPLYAAGAGGSEVGRALGNIAGALPYTVVVSREGRIVANRLGQVSASELRRWLDGQLAASPT
jgi:thiol-disulfide isomerase/thioredoxin